ncbi:NADP-dependent oxidoreductase [Membranihabitans marinus]|uniref:NADP-dependent oxidoreductase n=1 Tax=Membranihabitans marinus TaxID=1227546 RepID=UPI001F2A81A0|nr:NADP-dependent oxidoreductase [Membranihabitans marinus]
MPQTIILNQRPVGKPKLTDFKSIITPLPVVGPGEVLLKAIHVSVDPYLRGRMSDAKSYLPPFELGKPLSSGMIAEVIESRNDNYSKGDYVFGLLPWSEYQSSDGSGLRKVDGQQAPLTAYLGILGLTGLTAYLGLSEIGKPKPGETVFISGAAEAVGSVAGQICKILGCRVVGTAGSDEKVELLKSQFGFDEAINYKTAEDLNKDIAKACPNGIDVYFDNVGGNISEVVFFHINSFARLIICGSIAIYNEISRPMSIAVQPFLIKKSALMQGFVVRDFAPKFPEAMQQIATWMAEGKLTYNETIVEGFDMIPQAFIDLFEGKNKGKMVVTI